MCIFEQEADFVARQTMLPKAIARARTRLLAWCLPSNPETLAVFMATGALFVSLPAVQK